MPIWKGLRLLALDRSGYFTEGEDFFIYKNSAYKTWRKTEIKDSQVATLKDLLPRPAHFYSDLFEPENAKTTMFLVGVY